MADTQDVLYACGPGNRIPNGIEYQFDQVIRITQVPYAMAMTHGECGSKEDAATNSVLNLFFKVLQSCGSGLGGSANPEYRVLIELLVNGEDFNTAVSDGHATLGEFGNVGRLGYIVVIGFSNNGYDMFSAQLDKEIRDRMSRTIRKEEPAVIGTHQAIRSFTDLRTMLSYGRIIPAGTSIGISVDEDPTRPHHLLSILSPSKPLRIPNVCAHQNGQYVREVEDDPDQPIRYIWQAPYSRGAAGLNPFVYGFHNESLPWNLCKQGNMFNRTALLGIPTPRDILKRATSARLGTALKRKVDDWDDSTSFEEFFAQNTQDGMSVDPRDSVPVIGPPTSRRRVSRVVDRVHNRKPEETLGYPSLATIRGETERMLAAAGPTNLPLLFEYFRQVEDIIVGSSGNIVPPAYAKWFAWGRKLEDQLSRDAWAKGLFDDCRTLSDLVKKIQLCMAKFLGLSAAQIAFGFGVVFSGQVLPLLTMAPMLQVFCKGKAQAGKSKVVGDMLGFLFDGAVEKIDSVSSNGHNIDSRGDRTIWNIDEGLSLDPSQLEQWKTGWSDGLVTRKRPERNEETGKWEQRVSCHVWSSLTLATANRDWTMKGTEKDEEGLLALATRRLVSTMPNQAGRFQATANKNRQRCNLGIQALVQRATEMAPLNTAGVVFGSRMPLNVFYSFLAARGMPGFSSRRRDQFESVVFGLMQLRMYLEVRGLSRQKRYAYWLLNGTYRVEEIALAYKIFSEVDQTHVEEIVVKALANLIDFNREFSEGDLVGISAQMSDCGGFVALQGTFSVHRRALATLATAVMSSVPPESEKKIPDNGSILRTLEAMVDGGDIKICTVNSKPRYGIPPSALATAKLPSDRAVVDMIFKISNAQSIPQVSYDEKYLMLPESVLDAMRKGDMSAYAPGISAFWRGKIERYTLSALNESIARLEASNVLVRRHKENLAGYTSISEDKTPPDEQRRSVLKSGYNVVRGSEVANVIVFERGLKDRYTFDVGGKATPGEAVGDEFVSICAKHLWNHEVVGVCRYFGDTRTPPRTTIRKPKVKSFMVQNPDYEGCVDLAGPDDDVTRCLVDPSQPTFDLLEFSNLDHHSRRHFLYDQFPECDDIDGMQAALEAILAE